MDNPLDNEEQDKVTIFRTFHSLLMSGVRQRESEEEDRDMQMLQNNACRRAEDTNIVQCVSPLKYEYAEDDDYQADDSLSYDRDIFKREISNHCMGNQIIREEKIGENQLNNYQTAKKKDFNQEQDSKPEGMRFSCDQCDYQAANKVNLRRH